MTKQMPPCLIALSPGDLRVEDCDLFMRRLERAGQAGLRGLGLREKGLSDRAFAALLERALDVLKPMGGWIAVHDRAHLALTPTPRGWLPDAVHLGFRSLTPQLARRVIGEKIALGLSTHAQDDPNRLAGCDYAFHGPVLATPSKEGLKQPVGWKGLGFAVQEAQDLGQIPVWGIGGLNPGDAGSVRASGARGMVVLRGILLAPDPAPATEAYLAAWEVPVA